MSRLALDSPAKLNLFLHVTGRRADGYHLLQTLFQLIDLCDRMEFELLDSGALELECDRPELAGDDNLVLRAARLLRERCGGAGGRGARIRLHKRIPVGGGLGGGSSNAATTLLALDRLWGCGLSLADLAALGAGLGADVPVFVEGNSAFAEGIGEALRPVELPERWYLVISPACAVNTAVIFKNPELTRNTPAMTIADLLAGGGHNDCEAVTRKLYPPVDQALAWLGQFGDARMSGTGSSVFASFPDAFSAQRLQARVPAGWESFVARGLQRSPVHRGLYERVFGASPSG